MDSKTAKYQFTSKQHDRQYWACFMGITRRFWLMVKQAQARPTQWRDLSIVMTMSNVELFRERRRRSFSLFSQTNGNKLNSWSERLTCRYIMNRFRTCLKPTELACRSGRTSGGVSLSKDFRNGLSAHRRRYITWCSGAKKPECRPRQKWMTFHRGHMLCSSSSSSKWNRTPLVMVLAKWR